MKDRKRQRENRRIRNREAMLDKKSMCGYKDLTPYYVHKAERINGRRVQRIRIVWNCIGEFTPPMPQGEEKTA